MYLANCVVNYIATFYDYDQFPLIIPLSKLMYGYGGGMYLEEGIHAMRDDVSLSELDG